MSNLFFVFLLIDIFFFCIFGDWHIFQCIRFNYMGRGNLGDGDNYTVDSIQLYEQLCHPWAWFSMQLVGLLIFATNKGPSLGMFVNCRNISNPDNNMRGRFKTPVFRLSLSIDFNQKQYVVGISSYCCAFWIIGF